MGGEEGGREVVEEGREVRYLIGRSTDKHYSKSRCYIISPVCIKWNINTNSTALLYCLDDPEPRAGALFQHQLLILVPENKWPVVSGALEGSSYDKGLSQAGHRRLPLFFSFGSGIRLGCRREGVVGRISSFLVRVVHKELLENKVEHLNMFESCIIPIIGVH